MKKNYYDILNINKGATDDEIKKAYKKMALKYHPDRNKSPDATEKFKEISEAYQFLTNNNNKQVNPNMNFNQFNRQQPLNPNELFRNFNSHIRHGNNFQVFSNKNNGNFSFRQTNIQIINGKKVEIIKEVRNGETFIQKNISDL